jgi:hypothetical protein
MPNNPTLPGGIFDSSSFLNFTPSSCKKSVPARVVPTAPARLLSLFPFVGLRRPTNASLLFPAPNEDCDFEDDEATREYSRPKVTPTGDADAVVVVVIGSLFNYLPGLSFIISHVTPARFFQFKVK